VGLRGEREGNPSLEESNDGRTVVGDTQDKVTGKLKEKAGQAAGTPGLEQKGRDEQAKGNVKTSAKKAKDALKKGF
jgi:uncharacterized protein YjbJ (UPF0337 family)